MTKEQEKQLYWFNSEFLRMKLYTIQELTIFGVGEKVLYSWVSKKTLKPFLKIGQVAKFRYEDFENACIAANNETKEFMNPILHGNTQESNILNDIAKKFSKRKFA